MKQFGLVFFLFILMNLIQATRTVRNKNKVKRMLGGQQVTNQKAFPYQISLGSLTDDVPPEQRKSQTEKTKLASHHCGGVLLTSQWIMTAAHCVTYPTNSSTLPPAQFGIGFGSHDLVQLYEKGRVPITKIHVQHDYRRSDYFHDVALIQLASAIPNPPALACLGTKKTDLSNGGDPSLTITGWGNTIHFTMNDITGAWNPMAYSRYLNKLTMKDISSTSEQCQSRPDIYCTERVIPNTGPCRGDSGGPLIKQNSVVGVMSHDNGISLGNNETEYCYGQTQYTRLSSSIDWIRSIVNQPFCTTDDY